MEQRAMTWQADRLGRGVAILFRGKFLTGGIGMAKVARRNGSSRLAAVSIERLQLRKGS
jgi:hypothetical protein